MPERGFELPRGRRGPWWGWVLAAAVHAALIAVLVSHYRQVKLFTPVAGTVHSRDASVAFALPRPASVPAQRRLHATPPLDIVPAPAPTPLPRASSDVAMAHAVPAPTVDTPPASASLYPHYGTGKLWVEPLTETPRTIARTLTGKTDAQLDDSAITAMVQTYLNQMDQERREHPSSLPSWTTKIGGKTVGLDQRWIYLGPLKVPTALLALLPIHVQANPTEAEFNAKLQVMRNDLMEAARRSATYDDFKEAVKELHAETERQRQFKKNQSIPPPASNPE